MLLLSFSVWNVIRQYQFFFVVFYFTRYIYLVNHLINSLPIPSFKANIVLIWEILKFKFPHKFYKDVSNFLQTRIKAVHRGDVIHLFCYCWLLMSGNALLLREWEKTSLPEKTLTTMAVKKTFLAPFKFLKVFFNNHLCSFWFW